MYFDLERDRVVSLQTTSSNPETNNRQSTKHALHHSLFCFSVTPGMLFVFVFFFA